MKRSTVHQYEAVDYKSPKSSRNYRKAKKAVGNLESHRRILEAFDLKSSFGLSFSIK